MKTIICLLFILLSIISCRRDPEATCSDNIQNQDETGLDCGGACLPCPYIIYPAFGGYGENVLDQNKTSFTPNPWLSFQAEFYYGASAAIHWTTTSGTHGPAVIIHNGWSMTNVDYEFENWFHSTGDSTQLVEFYVPSPGSALVEYFENGADTLGAPTFSKSIIY